MIFSSSVHYVTTSGTITISESRRDQIVYTSQEIVFNGEMNMKSHIRYLGEGVNMDMALTQARDHFENHSNSDEEVCCIIKLYIIYISIF